MTIDRAPHADAPVLDALHSTPSRRHLAATPIPDEVIWARLADDVEDAPTWVFAVLRDAAHSINPRLGASTYGAVQPRALGARRGHRLHADGSAAGRSNPGADLSRASCTGAVGPQCTRHSAAAPSGIVTTQETHR